MRAQKVSNVPKVRRLAQTSELAQNGQNERNRRAGEEGQPKSVRRRERGLAQALFGRTASGRVSHLSREVANAVFVEQVPERADGELKQFGSPCLIAAGSS